MSGSATPPPAPPPAPPPSNGWTFERTIPVAVVVTLIGQIAVGVWYAASASKTLDDHERRIIKIEASVDDLSKRINDALSEIRERTARIETQVELLARGRTR